MKKLVIIAGIMVASASVARAQNIEIQDSVGPSGTHFTLTTPVTTYVYTTNTYCNYSYRYIFTTYLNGVQKTTQSFDVTPTQSPTQFQTTVDMSQWGCAAGDTVTFVSYATIIVRPYLGQHTSDYLYGDVKNPQGFAPRKGLDRSWLVDAIDDKRRFEELFS